MFLSIVVFLSLHGLRSAYRHLGLCDTCCHWHAFLCGPVCFEKDSLQELFRVMVGELVP